MRWAVAWLIILTLGVVLVFADGGKRRLPGKLSPYTLERARTKELKQMMQTRDPFNRARSLWWYHFNKKGGQR